jgi:hypothetical protein
MAKQTFTTGQVLTAAQVNSLQTNDFNQTVSAKTASYVLVAADKGTRIEFNTSGSVTCTVNTGIFDAGDTLIVQNRGAGAVTITAGTATVNTSGSLVVNQYESGTLYFVSASAALWFGSNPGDITGVTAGTGISGGGTSGTVTITNDMATTITAAGDIVIGTGSGTYDNLPIGTTGQVLTADTTVSPYKVKWATAGGGGKVLQVVSATYSTSTIVSSTTWTDTGLSATITPSSATSKVLVMCSNPLDLGADSAQADLGAGLRIMRGSTAIFGDISGSAPGASAYLYYSSSSILAFQWQPSYQYLDSPNTTSATTYKTQTAANSTSGGERVRAQGGSQVATITLLEIGA